MERIALEEQKRNVATLKEREANLSESEQVALELVDRVMAYHGDVPEELFQKLKTHFSDEEIVALFWQIGQKNGANWFNIAMKI